MTLKAVVFDLDGTLIDSRPVILDSLIYVLTKNNIKPKISLHNVRIGPPLPVILQALSGESEKTKIESMVKDFKEYYDGKAYKETKPYENIVKSLLRLRECNIPCFVATNKRFDATKLIIEHLQWQKLFVNIYSLDKTSPPYPDKAAMLASLLKAHDLEAETTIYVGDTPEDGIAAKRNNMLFAAALWGYGDFIENIPHSFFSPQSLLEFLVQ